MSAALGASLRAARLYWLPGMSAGDSSPAASHAGAAFASTQWSVIFEARSDATDRRAALEALCRAYWRPVYGYLRRRGHAPADAEDLTQGFFLHVLEGSLLDRSDPAKGRFRGYLVGALRQYLGSHFERERARKRGGGMRFLDATEAEREFAALDSPEADPGAVYEKSWALTLLARALRRLEEEQHAAGRGRTFAVLSGFLSIAPTPGDYERAAVALGTSRTTVAVWVHRLNQRYAELVKLEVAATVRDPSEVKQELHHLLQALRS